MARIGSRLVLDTGSLDVIVFLPGFLAKPENYRALLESVADAGIAVVGADLRDGRGAQLRGQPSANVEAARAIALTRDLGDSGRRVWLAGHSRGGQIAWRAAPGTAVAGLILIDPVDGEGRKPEPTTTREPVRFAHRPLVIGAGLGGPCAPANVNHDAFAAAAPTTHLVLPDCGHADMLDTWPRRLGRLACHGGTRPDAARETIAGLMTLFIKGELTKAATDLLPDEVSWR